MTDQSLGHWLRRERERRRITLRSISDQTKVALPLLQGLEDDDVSRWPSGIYRRAFVRAYATAVGLSAEEVLERFELEHGGARPVQAAAATAARTTKASPVVAAPQPVAAAPERVTAGTGLPTRARMLGTAADLTVALVIGLGSAAAGSRFLWPVLLIAAYYAVGVLLTGTSPMVALLREETTPAVVPAATPAVPEPRPGAADRHTPAQPPLRVVRTTTRTARQRAQ